MSDHLDLPEGDLPDIEAFHSTVASALADEDSALELLGTARERLAAEDAVVTLPQRRVMAVGDLHGHLGAALWVAARFMLEREAVAVFLGDYVDRGERQLETLAVALRLKELYPDRITLLRGNHETATFTANFGFRDETLASHGPAVYEAALDAFAEMPLVARRPDGVLLLHGGLPSGVSSMEELLAVSKPGRDMGTGIQYEMLLNDPEDRPGEFVMNMARGVGNTFGLDASRRLLDPAGVWLLVRAHQAVPSGHLRVHGGRVLTVFSHPDYKGSGSKGAVAFVGGGGEVSVETIDVTIV